jgi:hypothetical protein
VDFLILDLAFAVLFGLFLVEGVEIGRRVLVLGRWGFVEAYLVHLFG